MSIFTAAALCGVFSVFAGEVLNTSDEAALEKWGFAALYHLAETEPELEVSNGSTVQIPSSGGPVSVFSQAAADVSLTQNVELAGLALTVRPKKLRYTFSVADVRSFEVEFASGSDTNSLRANGGYRLGFGIAGSFTPLTMAGMGIGWSVDVRRLDVDLERFVSAAGLVPVSQRFVQDEIQAAVTASWRWKAFSPYAGLKAERWVTRLTDDATQQSLRGETDAISPLVGVEWAPFPGEGLQIEASFVDDESITASLFVKI